MSVSSISTQNKYLLWVKAGGRCMFRGCNKPLYQDILTKRNYNQSYIAHIVADVPGGPRGDAQRSSVLSNDINNLMLLCDNHHRLIDMHDISGHPEELLLEMKREHETRIENISSIKPEMQSHIVTYSANIGAHSPTVHYSTISKSLLPKFYPAQDSSINLGVVSSLNKDSDPDFWRTEANSLHQKFDRLLFPKINDNEVKQISLFGFAPIPLLVYLGTLLNDITSVDVHQKRRNPDTWSFDDDIETEYHFVTDEVKTNVALKIELSDNIVDSRITSVLGDDTSIYSIRIDRPDNDFVKSRKQIQDFGEKMKEAFREIKKIHGQDAVLNIFPAIPVSLAVQLGRVWMPKADLSMKIFDQNYALGGFVEAINISHS